MIKNIIHTILISSLLLLNFSFVGVSAIFAAGSARLYVDPASRTVNNGEPFTVTVRVDTVGETISGVQAYMSYPADKLDVLGLDSTGTALPIEFEATYGGGSIRMSRAMSLSPPTPVTGNNLLIGTITFKAKVGSGSANVGFVAGSNVIKYEDYTDILGPTTGGTYTFNTPVNPPIVDLRANGSAGSIPVNSGTNVTLSWTSTDTTSCTASGDWGGSKGTSGSEQTGALASNKSYTLRCEGAGGLFDTKTVQVNVSGSQPRPTVSISAKPSSIKSGETSTLSWSSTNATSVSITPGIGNVGTSGSKQVKPTASITYTALATGPGGNSSPASASITVDNKPPPPPPPPPTDTTACKITDVKVTGVSLKSATIEWKTDEPASELVEYGLLTKYNFRAESAELKKDHKVVLPSKLFVEATTYHYKIKCTDAAGNSGTTKDTTFKTRGYVVKIRVIDQTGKAVKGAEVILSSEIQTAKTDKDGVATFEDVTYGEHLVTVEVGGKPFDSTLKVKEATEKEITAGQVKPQTFDVKVTVVPKNFVQKYRYQLLAGWLLILVVVGFVWWRKRGPGQKGRGGGPNKGDKQEVRPQVQEVPEVQKAQGAQGGVEEFYKSLGPKPEQQPPEPKVPPEPKDPSKMEVFRS